MNESIAITGKKHSEETKEKMSVTHKSKNIKYWGINKYKKEQEKELIDYDPNETNRNRT
jgi:hypothetical protein